MADDVEDPWAASLTKECRDQAFAALAVETLNGSDDLHEVLADDELCGLIEGGVQFGIGATVAVFEERGFLNVRAIQEAREAFNG